MAKNKIIQVQGTDITLITQADEEYVNLTDMAKKFEGDPRDHIRNWLRNGSTIEFLGVWEKVHNTDFNVVEFHHIKSQFTQNTFIMSVSKWINLTGAIGINAKSGRYGGTYAHNEIALQFATWLSPEFYVYLVKEFKRLKTQEAQQEKDALEWSVKRTLAKVNYHIHTDAIKTNLIPARLSSNPKQAGFIYASEADLLNIALFGMTAKEWRIANPKTAGNIRDHATGEQLLVLANLESHNAEFIKDGLSQDERVHKLNEIAIYQMQVLVNATVLKGLSDKNN